MIDAVGYTAMVVNLITMSMKTLLHLCLISFVVSVISLFYNIFIAATSMIIGSVIAILLQGYCIFKNCQKTKRTKI